MNVNVELIPIKKSHYKFLYRLLQERDDSINISHRKIPEYTDHCMFWELKPYPQAHIISYTDEAGCGFEMAGYCYVTDRNEIGIFLDKPHQGVGLGKAVVQTLLEMMEGDAIANISPRNYRSRKFFEDLGFELVQLTLRKDGS